MTNKSTLKDKQIVFRLVTTNNVHGGIVRVVEEDGFWIESPHLIGQMSGDQAWAPTIKTIQTPVLFVPTSSLMFLIATKE